MKKNIFIASFALLSAMIAFAQSPSPAMQSAAVNSASRIKLAQRGTAQTPPRAARAANGTRVDPGIRP